jgi:hypothetical protein
VIQLDPDAAAGVADRQVGVKAAILDPKIIEVAMCLAGEVTELWMMPLGLKLGNHNDGQYHPVLGEPANGCRVCQQDAGVQDVGTPGLADAERAGLPPGLTRHGGHMAGGTWLGRSR